MSEPKTSTRKRKQILWLTGTALLLILAVAVIVLTNPGAGGATGTFSLTVSLDNSAEILFDEPLSIQADQSLLQIMEANELALEADNGLITSLCNVSQDTESGKYWLYTINGEFAMVGAGDYFPKSDDKIVFDLHAFEE